MISLTEGAILETPRPQRSYWHRGCRIVQYPNPYGVRRIYWQIRWHRQKPKTETHPWGCYNSVKEAKVFIDSLIQKLEEE
jgi:hypothetical protein